MRHAFLALLSFASTLALLTACASSSPHPQPSPAEVQDRQPSTRDSAEAATAIAKVFEDWIRAYEADDADAHAALFTEDAIYAAQTGQLLRGRHGIREGVRGWIARRPQMLATLGVSNATGIDVREDVVRFRRTGDAAHTLFRFMIRVEPSGCFINAGHALAVWRLQDGGAWRIESLTVNLDREPPEGACGRR